MFLGMVGHSMDHLVDWWVVHQDYWWLHKDELKIVILTAAKCCRDGCTIGLQGVSKSFENFVGGTAFQLCGDIQNGCQDFHGGCNQFGHVVFCREPYVRNQNKHLAFSADEMKRD